MKEKKIAKLKKVVVERDRRFWLMIFVVLSTLVVLLSWSLDFKNIFFIQRDLSSGEGFDFTQIKTDIQGDVNQTFKEFSELLEEQMNKEQVDNLGQTANIDRVRAEIEKKKSESVATNTSDSDVSFNDESVDSDVNENISDMEKSDEILEDLRKKIEDLERRLER